MRIAYEAWAPGPDALVTSWELDALDPATLDALVTRWINTFLDDDRFQAARDRQELDREQLTAVSQRWTDVTGFLNQ